MEPIPVEDFIRTRAEMNWSRRMVREALGISDYSFREICRVMTDVKWCSRNEGVVYREAQAARRGVSTPELREAAKRAKIAKYKTARQYTICGYTGSATQQMQMWGDLVTVSIQTIRRRARNGMSTLDAFFLPQQETCAVSTKGDYWSRK